MTLDYESAKNMLLASDIKGCQHFFEKKHYLLELGYCALLDDDLDRASKIFKSIRKIDKRANWAAFLVDLLNERFNGYPTYFELRNFLEIDINIFINSSKGDYVEKIASYADFLFTINPEVYKFIGRVFLNNDLEQYGIFFLKRAKDNFYNDPELHFLLAEFYYKHKNYLEAQKSLNSCLKILPGYFPAVNLLKKVSLLV